MWPEKSWKLVGIVVVILVVAAAVCLPGKQTAHAATFVVDEPDQQTVIYATGTNQYVKPSPFTEPKPVRRRTPAASTEAMPTDSSR